MNLIRPAGVLCLCLLAAGVPNLHGFDTSSWFTMPGWFRPLSRELGRFVYEHQNVGLFLVIYAEELGIPLPAPGDVAIAWAGYLTTTGAIPHATAYVAVIVGAVTGSMCLYGLSRRFGHPFLVRFGGYIGLDEERLHRAERAFRRWGPWAIIIGRHIPGMRIVISAFSGAFDVPPKVFVPCVAVSATAWAAIFIELGRALGRNSRHLFQLLPLHLLPLLVLGVAVLAVLYTVYERVSPLRARARARRDRSRGHDGKPAPSATIASRVPDE